MINYALSTLKSIARHEAEINNLAQRYTRKALSVNAETGMTAVPNDLAAITAMPATGEASALVYEDNLWKLPAGTYIRFICSGNNTYFSLLEGTGSIITSADGDHTLTLASDPKWVDVQLVRDWQDKIELANEAIYNQIYSNLAAVASQDQISVIIADIANPEILGIASDYKTLEFIFMDLWGKVGNTDTISTKIDYYHAKYDEAFSRAFRSLDFGEHGYVFESSQGRISR